jgi:hypothetical protein
MKQYYHRHIQLPAPGQIRELEDRTGKVRKLARVTSIDRATRQAELELISLDRRGRERTK